MDPRPEFTSLQRQERLSAQAADQIAHMILDQQLPVGSKLPSERQLAEALGVSRTVIREAIRLLEARRLISVQTGSGAVVLGPGPAPVTESIHMLMESAGQNVSFEDLQTVRGVLEVATAGIAASQATPADLAIVAEALDRMTNAPTVDEQIRADYDFHLAIARATHNQIFVLLLQALNDILVQTWRAYWEGKRYSKPADYVAADEKESDRYHALIYEAIKEGDAEKARQAMVQMLAHWGEMYSGAPASACSEAH